MASKTRIIFYNSGQIISTATVEFWKWLYVKIFQQKPKGFAKGLFTYSLGVLYILLLFFWPKVLYETI